MDQKRNYKKELEREKQICKRYVVKVPLYMAKVLDEKLARDNKKYSKFARESIEKYIKKI